MAKGVRGNYGIWRLIEELEGCVEKWDYRLSNINHIITQLVIFYELIGDN